MYWTRHWILVSLGVVWCLAILAFPWLMHSGYLRLSIFISLFFSKICHQIGDRSITLHGLTLPVCSRCFAIYLGSLTGILAWPLVTLWPHRHKLVRFLFVGGVGLTGLDIGFEKLGILSNSFASRLFTGSLLGVSLGLALAMAIQGFDLLEEAGGSSHVPCPQNFHDSSLLRMGTSAWSNPSWEGVFYPAGAKSSDYLRLYAAKLDCVEIDNTFYRIPSSSMVRKWDADTPSNFLFTAKVPRSITHDKVLRDCEEDLSQFLKSMDGLGNKLAALLLQFPYFNKQAFGSRKEFFVKLRQFLPILSKEFRWAVEIRNKAWVCPEFLEILRAHEVSFTLIDQAWMTPIHQLFDQLELETTDFVYIRWLGDRKGIEEITTSWDRVVVDRQEDLKNWLRPVRSFLTKGKQVYGFFNNHYAGHAPASLEMFRSLLKESH
ncbi:MAG: DUF72 domain-containing protein [Terriglobia bacterium]